MMMPQDKLIARPITLIRPYILCLARFRNAILK